VDVAIINYEMGNIASVEKAIRYLGYNPVVTNLVEEIQKASHIVLPGVGAFAQGMNNLNKLGLIDILNEEVIINKKPFFGICLGMHLLATKGYEPIETKGLDWIPGEVVKMSDSQKSIPHLGWNEILVKGETFVNNFDKKDFYFIHSYHFKVLSANDIVATVNYGNDYAAIIKRDNIFATQFHPEKSQAYGLAMMKSFFTHYA
jgi:glutamine amidotransferase